MTERKAAGGQDTDVSNDWQLVGEGAGRAGLDHCGYRSIKHVEGEVEGWKLV